MHYTIIHLLLTVLNKNKKLGLPHVTLSTSRLVKFAHRFIRCSCIAVTWTYLSSRVIEKGILTTLKTAHVFWKWKASELHSEVRILSLGRNTNYLIAFEQFSHLVHKKIPYFPLDTWISVYILVLYILSYLGCHARVQCAL
jgi:hypothetical protein